MLEYERIIIIGRSELASRCALTSAREYPSIKTVFYNVREERQSIEVLQQENLVYRCAGKAEIMRELLETDKKTLVFSIMNTYLFPQEVIENPALCIINLHHALLPKHPGRNAEVWALFEGDDVTGITWHMIVEKVDAGEIISQQQVKITEQMTSLSLFRALNRASADSFFGILKLAAENSVIKTYPQPSGGHDELRFAKEKPNNGMLCLDWDIEKMYRFVRAMDYGVLKVMGDPTVLVNGKTYTWKKYELVDSGISMGIDMAPNEISISKDGKTLRLINIKEIA